MLCSLLLCWLSQHVGYFEPPATLPVTESKESFFFQILLLRKRASRYFLDLKNKYEEDDHEEF
jgi:hypothetical protein